MSNTPIRVPFEPLMEAYRAEIQRRFPDWEIQVRPGVHVGKVCVYLNWVYASNGMINLDGFNTFQNMAQALNIKLTDFNVLAKPEALELFCQAPLPEFC